MARWWVYMIECSDKTFYTGITNDIAKRVQCHNTGKGGHYTRSRIPVKLIYKESHRSRSSALKREYQIKQLTRSKKALLLN